MSNVLLKMEHVTKNFGGLRAVDDFSMEVPDGSIYGIIGPNGAGKTTIFNLISGIYKPDSGTVWLDGEDITHLSQERIAACGVSRTFQNIRLFKGLSVLDNVKVAQDYGTSYGVLQALISGPKVKAIEKKLETEAFEHLKLMHLESYAEEKPENLSYGIQRRLEIARALSMKPKIMLLDEPAAGLNPEEVIQLIKFIREIKRNMGVSILIIEHRMDVIMGLCERIYVQDFGVNIAVGTPKEIQADEKVLAAYLGGESVCSQ